MEYREFCIRCNRGSTAKLIEFFNIIKKEASEKDFKNVSEVFRINKLKKDYESINILYDVVNYKILPLKDVFNFCEYFLEISKKFSILRFRDFAPLSYGDLNIRNIEKYPFDGVIISKTTSDNKTEIFFTNRDKISICRDDSDFITKTRENVAVFAEYYLDTKNFYKKNFSSYIRKKCRESENLTVEDFFKGIGNYQIKSRDGINRVTFPSEKDIMIYNNVDNVIVRMELIVPTDFLKDGMRILLDLKKEIYKECYRILSKNREFQKLGVGIEFFRISKATAIKTGLMWVIFESKF